VAHFLKRHVRNNPKPHRTLHKFAVPQKVASYSSKTNSVYVGSLGYNFKASQHRHVCNNKVHRNSVRAYTVCQHVCTWSYLCRKLHMSNSNRWLPKRARLRKLSHDSDLVILHSTTKHNRNCCFHNVHYVTPFQDLEVSDLLSLSPDESVHLPYCYYWSWELQSTI
jgi:hypothetical protein